MSPAEPVAITGMAAVLPGAPDLGTYWHNLRTGVDAIGDIPEPRRGNGFHRTDLDPSGPIPPDVTYCHRGGFLTDPVCIDPARFGIVPHSVPDTEPDQLIALTVAAAAVADAGGVAALGDPGRVGVILGRGGYLSPGLLRFGQRVRAARQVADITGVVQPSTPDLDAMRAGVDAQFGPLATESLTGLVPNLTASRIANRLDFGGPAYTVDAACASSLLAVHQAVGELAAGRCDTVLAGGVHHCHDDTLWSVFTQLRALSPSQCIRPLSRDADGLLIGEGTGVVVLRRLTDARRDGDRIYATVLGTGVSSDGRTGSPLRPDSAGQVRAVRAAWSAAGLDPAAPGSVGLLEAHGTATRAGDDAELHTLAEVFGAGPADAVVGSVKSMIGHTMPAAGIAGLIKSALALYNATLLPTLHCADPNPLLATTRFRTLAEARPWEGRERRAAVNAFGFGGANAHVVLAAEPDPRPASMSVTEPEPVLRLAAPDPESLARLLDDPPAEQTGTGPCRVAVLAPDPARLALARKALAKARDTGQDWPGRRDVWVSLRPALAGDGALALVFPGLEAEFAPRCADVAAHFGLPRPPTDTATLAGHADAVLRLGLFYTEVLARIRVRAHGYAGHSVGEWTAMVAAGMLDYERFAAGMHAALRDEESLPPVDFLALGCSAGEAAERAAGRRETVVSHENAPHQSVVCGPADELAALAARCRADGIFARTLPFRSGFHTPMFAPCLPRYADALAACTVGAGRVPVWSATTGGRYPSEVDGVRALFLRHLVEPVRFTRVVDSMYRAGTRGFLMLGAGQVGSFVDDTLGAVPHLTAAVGTSRRAGMSQLRWVAAGLWAAGLDPDFTALHGPARRTATGTGGATTVPIDTTPTELSLPAIARALITTPPPHATPTTELAPIPRQRPAVTAAFASLLRESEHAAQAVLAAAATAPTASTPLSAAGTTTVPATTAHSTATPPSVSPAATALPPSATSPHPGPAAPTVPAPRATTPPWPRERRTTLMVNLRDLPYLAGHRFFRQRDGWPDESDRRPVVAATTVLALAEQRLRACWPDAAVTDIADAQFRRWLVADPAQEVPVQLTRTAPDAATVQVGEFATLRATLGAARPAPPPWPVPADDRPAPVTAEAVYRDRLMFHGPPFHTIAALYGIGAAHIRGTLTVLPAPGALLDGVGQLLGVWLLATHDDGLLAFPRRIREVRRHGPPPVTGETLECLVLVRTATADTLEMDTQLRRDGEVVTEIRGWADTRFECDRRAHRAYAFPHRHRLSTRHPGGWTLFADPWSTHAARELFAGVYLGAAERAALVAHPPRGRRHRLLGRIAAKDAVLALLGDREVYPAELLVTNDDTGAPRVIGRHGLALPPLAISVAHSGDLGVALARHRDTWPPPGIDVQQVTPALATIPDTALATAERALLAERAAPGTGDHALWCARFWAAKEAAAKARGTGLRWRPKDFRVTAIDTDTAEVRVGDWTVPIALTLLPEHHSVVAATTDVPKGQR